LVALRPRLPPGAVRRVSSTTASVIGARRLDMGDYRRWTVDGFSGSSCVEELYLGRHSLPLGERPAAGPAPVALALGRRQRRPATCGGPSGTSRPRGFAPEVVVTDGSPPVPGLACRAGGPARGANSAISPLGKDINAKVLEAVRRLRRRLADRGNRGRRREPGRAGQGPSENERGQSAALTFSSFPVLFGAPLLGERNPGQEWRKATSNREDKWPWVSTLRLEKVIDLREAAQYLGPRPQRPAGAHLRSWSGPSRPGHQRPPLGGAADRPAAG